ncbi:hypothetical protein VOLCADRAFT_107294 [Volvox carteri f. nagariensis]|uniref:Erythromycin biosynthesis protein CIII-like C-terminal domain-containing protein n=1 Tax=Volvox carteri f. nagariensis TaxID=3068 RepID=D8UD21_VOLCA|nr:uncharacterized protein VOLCADRAFT_107294 [Volvox carteri f. nagariensis]EFJ42354.1 hypothetical protein VOLCADRAFT_107294 [Volvox carteri f. nagariensis]|eukprot:XP_002956587.1 hypothetical protein VOLCADRAFT_107294 [Volvox carteri f. nagariensis]
MLLSPPPAAVPSACSSDTTTSALPPPTICATVLLLPTTFTFSPTLEQRQEEGEGSGKGEGRGGADSARSSSTTASSSPSPTGHVSRKGGPPRVPQPPFHSEPHTGDRKPIYIGFGSMTVSEGRAVAAAIREAVAATGVRAVMSAGNWGCLTQDGTDGGRGEGKEEENGCAVSRGGGSEGALDSTAGAAASPTGGGGDDDILFVHEDVPHTWLFPRCSAVIHHGGVGTTAAGLMAGCPTFIAPSFGDLFFWGELCGRAGVGPAPIPIYKLTARDLERAIRVLMSENVRAAAKRVGSRLSRLKTLPAKLQRLDAIFPSFVTARRDRGEARNGPNLDLQKLHEAREIPAGQRVDFSVVIGHAVYQTNSDTKVLPPGCMTGLEFLRFYKMPMDMGATTTATSSQGTLPPGGVHGLGSATSDTMVSSAIKAITDSLRGFAGSFRILTSSADTNARLSKTWSSIVNFDPHQYADKFEAQAYKNLDSMTKWMRDLQDAVFKPKA